VAAWRAAAAARPGDGDAAHALGAALLNAGDWRAAAATWAGGAIEAPSHPLLSEVASTAALLALDPAAADAPAAAAWAAPSAWARLPAGRGAAALVSAAPLLSAAQCAAVIAEAEAHAASRGGWATARHYAVPTTDVPLRSLGASRALLLEAIGAAVAPALRAAHGVPSASLRVHDAFVVRYDAEAGQASLPRHADQSHFSLTLALNAPPSFAGGGTHFPDMAPHVAAVLPPPGHAVLFPGALQHAGAPITAGVRYIVAAFLWVDADAPDADVARAME
jgi:predicted 2-oxoglutarate/Fe(II)-dependent dioxygenase YbiX